ncbi:MULTISPECIES: hypothetical protein [Sphingomonas]|uniref:Uncharacterized protein n=1 Tax=Sphingomonas molluscorum TaxID=418184 RepID=A0ABU8Q7J0_9SPHN|nr:hypothetical protein [Sphingomonas sp. JUb134]MBM7407051.1 hypothetical protein [Sphingomonas sp. JUb134]
MIDNRPDAAAQAALAADVRRPVTFAFLDLASGPIRVTNAPYSFTFSGTGDEDLDGFTFEALDPRFVSVGPVKAREGGSDTLTLQLSGLTSVDDELMTDIGDRANYAGRDCRLWRAMLDPQNLTQIGTLWSYFTGYMSVPHIQGDRQNQTINLEVETYLAFFGQASNRTYLDQQLFDPGDRSAELAIAIANGASRRRT